MTREEHTHMAFAEVCPFCKERIYDDEWTGRAWCGCDDDEEEHT